MKVIEIAEKICSVKTGAGGWIRRMDMVEDYEEGVIKVRGGEGANEWAEMHGWENDAWNNGRNEDGQCHKAYMHTHSRCKLLLWSPRRHAAVRSGSCANAEEVSVLDEQREHSFSSYLHELHAMNFNPSTIDVTGVSLLA